jgi:protein tyrosine phosphatase (PTP) superfamily phosphohydrolase (DUF442 family)
VISKIFAAQLGVFAIFLSLSPDISWRPPQADTATTSPPKHVMAVPRRVAEVPNFAEVTPRLYRGGQPGIQGIVALKQMGMDIVVDMRGGHNRKEQAELEKRGMRYVSIPWHCPLPRDKPFARFLELIEQNSKKKIFVHCRLGDDRTGMAVAAYRMAEEGWSAEEAMKEMKRFGFTRAHHAICPTLAHYAKTFPHRLRTSPAFKELRPSGTSSRSK